MQVPDRVRSALEVLDVSPSDRLLEIGPGSGVTAGLLGDLLVDGHLVAIDRSETAIRRTLARSRAHAAAGRVTVEHASLEDFDGPTGSFDKVFAINVNLFWTRDATAELEKIKRLLTPTGALYLFYETPSPAKTEEITTRLGTVLSAADLDLTVKMDGGLVTIIGRKSGT